MLKKTLKYLGKTLLGVLAFLLLTVIAEWLLSKIILNQEQHGGTVTVYLLSNGVHTDIVLPASSSTVHWDTLFPVQNTLLKDTTLNYLGIGWGDKGFYLETPTWADLKTSTALKATTGLSSSALHCTYMKAPLENEQCIKIQINEQQYSQLTTFILATATYDSLTAKPQLINTHAVYGGNDAFYEAKGSYNMFNTCNTWTNSALKKADMRCAFWLLFEGSMLGVYQ